MHRTLFTLATTLVLASCQPPLSQFPTQAPKGAQWLLQGSQDERMIRVARHLRGFDMAMAETGYRYSELYWAGRDRNWGYARYQLKKLEKAISNGTERRPVRAASARMIEGPIQQVRQAIQEKDDARMDTTLQQLTTTCNACHQAERVPFIHVAPPTVRLSPVQPNTNTP